MLYVGAWKEHAKMIYFDQNDQKWFHFLNKIFKMVIFDILLKSGSIFEIFSILGAEFIIISQKTRATLIDDVFIAYTSIFHVQ